MRALVVAALVVAPVGAAHASERSVAAEEAAKSGAVTQALMALEGSPAAPTPPNPASSSPWGATPR